MNTLWFWGLLAVLGSAYFGVRSGWRAAFYAPGILVLLVGLAGATHELAKRETKGAGWYWVPGLVWLTIALILHFVKVLVDIWSVWEMVLGVSVVVCLIADMSYLLPMIPYRFSTPTRRPRCWRTSLRRVFRKTQQQNEQPTSKLTKADVSIVAYRLLIMLSIFSIPLALLTVG